MCFQLCVDLLYSQVHSSLVAASIEGKSDFFPSWEGSLKRVILLLPHGGGKAFIPGIFVQ